MPREALGPLALVGVALAFLVKAALSWPGFGHVVTSLLIVLGVLIVAAAGFGVLVLGADRARRTHRFRIDPGGAPEDAISHEVAHVEVGIRHGGRCVKGRVFADGGGWVDVRLPRGAPLAHEVAVDMAGARGEGVSFWWSSHAAGDRANAESRVAHLPDDERQRVYREAERVSTPGFWYGGSASGIRRALETTGSYR
jgi:hypothetical protein